MLQTSIPRRRSAVGEDDDAPMESPEEVAERTQYSRTLDALTAQAAPDTHILPPELYELQFSRSSGPGGQNVNKLNTKATIRFYLAKACDERIAKTYSSAHATQKSLLPLPMPKSVAGWIAKFSPYYKQSFHSVLISSSKERSQGANKRDALEKVSGHWAVAVWQLQKHQGGPFADHTLCISHCRKMVEHLKEVIGKDIRGETSQESLDRLKAGERKFAARMKKTKMANKAKTAGRRGSGMY